MHVLIEKSQHDSCGFRLTTELALVESRAKVFQFYADAFNLQTLTPAWLHFEVRTPAPIAIETGTVIDYRLRLHGLPFRWRSRISHWAPPFEFIDEQLQGPYRYWRHLHIFEESEGGTLVRDVVDYSLPLSFLLHPLLVRRDLTKIFEFRRCMMSRIFTPQSSALSQSNLAMGTSAYGATLA